MAPAPKPALDGKDIAAIVLSFVIPGAGQMMLGQVKKGLAILAGTICTCGVGYLATIVIAIDVYLLAMCNKERQVGEWEIFPEHKRYLNK
jgi:TM2 domain-containing membrane protein YozV